MMLGRNHISTLGMIWSTAEALELCPMGTVIRNGVDHRSPAGAGTHLIKVAIKGPNKTFRGFDPGGAEWVPCAPNGTWRHPEQPWTPLRAKNIPLPVQVVKRGAEE